LIITVYPSDALDVTITRYDPKSTTIPLCYVVDNDDVKILDADFGLRYNLGLITHFDMNGISTVHAVIE
jgi:hypothetical protein